MGKVERGVSSSRVCLVSILEGGEQQPEWPVGLSVVDEHSEVVLNFLVDSFCLSIGLWVMCSARGSLDVELLVKVFYECGHEDGSSV